LSPSSRYENALCNVELQNVERQNVKQQNVERRFTNKLQSH
jgi:hypothetical protein